MAEQVLPIPGDLVKRGQFINYVYRWNDCDMAGGCEATALRTPLLWRDPLLKDDQCWPTASIAMVLYASPASDAPCCLVLTPNGPAWVPTSCIEVIAMICEEGVKRPDRRTVDRSDDWRLLRRT